MSQGLESYRSFLLTRQIDKDVRHLYVVPFVLSNNNKNAGSLHNTGTRGETNRHAVLFPAALYIKHDLPPWGFHLPWSPMCEGSKASFSLAPTSFSCPPGRPTPLFFLAYAYFLSFLFLLDVLLLSHASMPQHVPFFLFFWTLIVSTLLCSQGRIICCLKWAVPVLSPIVPTEIIRKVLTGFTVSSVQTLPFCEMLSSHRIRKNRDIIHNFHFGPTL